MESLSDTFLGPSSYYPKGQEVQMGSDCEKNMVFWWFFGFPDTGARAAAAAAAPENFRKFFDPDSRISRFGIDIESI